MKEKVHIEYIFPKVSVNTLWKMIGTPIGLSKWFCDACACEENQFRFKWHKSEQGAECLKLEDGNFIRFRWEDEEHPGAFFEFKVSKSEITKDATLQITDYAYNDEEKDCIDLWNTQVDSLRRVLGA